MNILKLVIILKVSAWADVLSYSNFKRSRSKHTLDPGVQDSICKKDTWQILASSPFKFEQNRIDFFFLQSNFLDFEIQLSCKETSSGLKELEEIWVTCSNYKGSDPKHFNKYLVKPSLFLINYHFQLENIENKECQSMNETFNDFGVISPDVWYLVGWLMTDLYQTVNIACVILSLSVPDQGILMDNILTKVVNQINEDYFPGVTNDSEKFAKIYSITTDFRKTNYECKESPSIDHNEVQCLKRYKTEPTLENPENPKMHYSIIFGCTLLILWLAVIGIDYCWKKKTRVVPTNQTT